MTSYHRKHETTPTDKVSGTKLLNQEQKLHKQKGLPKDKIHEPHQQKPAKKK